VVAREWRRSDLAVLNDGLPLALLEAKALYTFDVVHGMAEGSEYHRFITADLAKASGLGGADAQVFALVISTHVLTIVPPSMRGIVKYDDGINRALATFSDPVGLRVRALRNVGGFLESLGTTTRHDLGRGCALGLEVELDVWLVGPVLH
jgi:hypothetical protein